MNMFRSARIALFALSASLLFACLAALPGAAYAAALSCPQPPPTPSFGEDTPVTGVPIGCSDSDGAVTYALGSMPLRGTAAINSDAGTWSYTPNANFNGTDSFGIIASQGGEDAIVTITLTFLAFNDTTSCAPLTLTTRQGNAVTGQISCTDADNGGFTYVLFRPPNGGKVLIAANGVVTYTPNAGTRTFDDFVVNIVEGGVPYGMLVNVAIVNVDRGGSGADALIGGIGADTLYGNAGNDTLDGRGGNDVLFGGPGNDGLVGGLGNDVLNGGLSNDRLVGGDGSDRLIGGPGNDQFNGGKGSDTIIANDTRGAVDTVQCGAGRDTVVANPQDRVAADCEQVTRSA